MSAVWQRGLPDAHSGPVEIEVPPLEEVVLLVRFGPSGVQECRFGGGYERHPVRRGLAFL